jgi:RNA polymerase sigma factor (sigma-70 family)
MTNYRGMGGRHERRAAPHPPTAPPPVVRLVHVTDLALTALARDGDSAAMGELYTRHFETTVHGAGRYASHTHSAEDLASEAFTGMLLALRQGRGPSENVAGYLAVAARNAAFSHHRRRLHPASAAATEPDQLERRAHPARSALEELLARESAEVIDEVLGRLPPRWREVLVLTFFDELSGPEVAQHLGISATAVRALRHRARRAFGDAFAEAMGEAGDDAGGPDSVTGDGAVPGGAAG